MAKFEVTWTQNISIIVEAESYKECKDAALSANPDDFSSSDGWDLMVSNARSKDKLEYGVCGGKILDLKDYQEAKEKQELEKLDFLICPRCDYKAPPKEFVVSHSYLLEESSSQLICPNCLRQLLLKDALPPKPIKDTQTINMFENLDE